MGAIPKRCVVDLRSSFVTEHVTHELQQFNLFFNKHADTLPFLKVFILYKNRFVHF